MPERILILLLAFSVTGMVACAGTQNRTDEGPGTGLEALRRACLDDEQKEAAAACRKVLRVKPRDAEVEHRLGWMLVLNGDVPEGIAHLRKSQRLKPGVPEVCYHLGLALEKRGDRGAALGAYTKALSAKNDYTEALIAKGICLRKQGRKQQAMQILQQAVAIDPKSAPGWAQLSLTFAQLSQLDKAIKAGTKAVELKPEDANVRSNLGLFMTYAGRISQAVEQLERAVEIEADNPNAWYNLGLAYTQADALEEAAHSYHRSITLREEFPEAHHNLAVILMNLGLCQASKRHFDRAHQLRVKSAPVVLEQYRKLCEQPEESEEKEGEQGEEKIKLTCAAYNTGIKFVLRDKKESENSIRYDYFMKDGNLNLWGYQHANSSKGWAVLASLYKAILSRNTLNSFENNSNIKLLTYRFYYEEDREDKYGNSRGKKRVYVAKIYFNRNTFLKINMNAAEEKSKLCGLDAISWAKWAERLASKIWYNRNVLRL